MKMNENFDDASNNDKKDTNNNVNMNRKMNIYSYPVNNQLLSHATNIDFTPLRIKCNPILSDNNTALKFVQEFFFR
jgi:hypothetical protein